MNFKRTVLVAACLALGPVAVFAGGPDANLFPVSTGSVWNYSGSAAGKAMSLRAEITSVTKSGNATLAVFKWSKGGTAVQEETYRITASEVARVRAGAGGSGDITPPVPVIRYPMTVGKTWKWAGKISTPGGAFQGSAVLKVASKDSVKTGAGSLQAYRVDMSLTLTAGGQSLTIPNTYWFAPGKGLIKQSAPNQKVEAVLSSYKKK